jgi:glutaredoxin
MADFHVACQARMGTDGGLSDAPAGAPAAVDAQAATPVILYGASWCEACGVAKRYMTWLHIPFVDRDVEEDPSAAGALAATMKASGLADHPYGLPVLDVRGTVMVGFSPCNLERAWAAPRRP